MLERMHANHDRDRSNCSTPVAFDETCLFGTDLSIVEKSSLPILRFAEPKLEKATQRVTTRMQDRLIMRLSCYKHTGIRTDVNVQFYCTHEIVWLTESSIMWGVRVRDWLR